MDSSTSLAESNALLEIAHEASDLLLRQSESIHHYVKRAGDTTRVVLQKRDSGDAFDSADPTDGATSTAFAISRLARASQFEPLANTSSVPVGVSRSEWVELAATIKHDFVLMYGPGDSNSDGGAKSAGNLPNYYSTSLHVSGLLTAVRLSDSSPDSDLTSALHNVISVLAAWLTPIPFVSGESLTSTPDEVDDNQLHALADGSPNWYLTYLVSDALASFLDAAADEKSDAALCARKALDQVRAASLLALSRMIALSSSGLSGIFDALELGGCLASLGRCISATGQSDLITSRLINRGIELLGSDFLTPYGAFAPKGPAMVDRNGALLEISSSELAEAVLSSLDDLLDDHMIAVLLPAIRLTFQRSEGHRGWGVGNQGGANRRDVFVASSSLALLSEFTARMDQMRHRLACEALDVEQPPDMGSIDYPKYLESSIQTQVIRPIRAGRRDLAAMSMLLYGPPGTAKTTIARKIASDLGWPILELTPSRLLLTGFEEITSRAEDLFSLLADLRNVVVLFDEFEGFIGRRDNHGASDASKFLTTFMLPKLHRLRDLGQVVFVVATNDQTAIDSAASRPGRIDTVISVDPPSVDEVRMVIQLFSRRTPPLNNLDEKWESLWLDVSSSTNDNEIAGLTYGYISRWVKDVALEFHEDYSKDTAMTQLTKLRERLKRETSQKPKKNKK